MVDLSAHDLLTTTRAVRRRLDLTRPVARQLIRECVEVALQAPAGANDLGYQFVVVDDPGTCAALAEIYQQAFAEYRRETTLVTEMPERPDERQRTQHRIFESAAYLAEHLAEVPVLVIPCMAGRAEIRDTARRQAGYWGSVFPAIWSFMLAARLRGLGTALTTMHLRFERETASLLDIPFDEVTQCGLLPLAHTLGDRFKPARRAPAESFLSWNRWSPG